MSLFANIEHLAAAPGVVAVTIDSPSHPRAFRGVDNWAPVLDASLQLFGQTGEDTIRLVIGQHTAIIQKELGDTVAVVLPTGHAIAKSLRRMIRRLAKKERGPVQTTRPTQPYGQGADMGMGMTAGADADMDMEEAGAEDMAEDMADEGTEESGGQSEAA
jgi:hypothetical protein